MNEGRKDRKRSLDQAEEKFATENPGKQKAKKYVAVEMENRQKRRNMVEDIESVEGRGKDDEEN